MSLTLARARPLRHLAWRISVILGLTLHPHTPPALGFLVRLLVARPPLLVLQLVLVYTIQCCQQGPSQPSPSDGVDQLPPQLLHGRWD